jgi:predicted ribosomally synthesized peptide with nif11-like leader
MFRDSWFLATTKKEMETMLNHIKTLLSDVQLQQQVKKATNLAEVIKLIVTAGVAKGYNFSKEGVTQVLATLAPMEENELSEEELLAVSGGGSCTCKAGAVTCTGTMPRCCVPK